jgi:predicted kinase
MAHSPLGGPRRAGRVSKDESLASVAQVHIATEEEIALAWVLDVAPNVVAIPGARRPETARSAARAASLALDEDERERLRIRPSTKQRRRRSGDVVLVMGIPGAGKSRVADTFVERGYVRLNRDERGGTLGQLVAALDGALDSGAREVVLDNTYLARAWRNDVVATAARHGLPVRCVWVDTPLAQAQVNLVERLLDRFDRLPSPEELRVASRREQGLLTPTRQMRALRELEPPTEDEGFASVQRVPFSRAPRPGRPGAFLAAGAVERFRLGAVDGDVPHLVFDWRPDGATADLDALAARLPAVVVETAACTHGGGPPTCWCRPPLPGLLLEFARRHGVDPGRSVVVGASTAHRTLANALGARYVSP